MNERNWAGNYSYGAENIFYPQTIGQICEIVRASRKVRALGTRHSFNGIADSEQNLISLSHLNRIVHLDHVDQTVTVQAGIKYGELGESLHFEGFALHNLASLPHISVAGACATATHGSGENNGNLATAVVGMEIVNADGEIISIAGDQLHGAAVSLGALGIITQLTLKIVPTFNVRQYVYENLPQAEMEKHFDEIQASAYSVSLFTDWQSDRINQIWLKRTDERDPAATFFGATAAPVDRHPITEISAENCTQQMGIAGPWHERLPHFKMNYTPSSGEELQSEYFVPRNTQWPRSARSDNCASEFHRCC